MEDITKLPKWAQALIKELKKERDEYQTRWESVFAREPTSIQVRDVHNKPTMFLSPYAYIYFKIKKKQGIEGNIRIYFDSDQRLVLQGEGVFNILPKASDCFHIEMGDQ